MRSARRSVPRITMPGENPFQRYLGSIKELILWAWILIVIEAVDQIAFGNNLFRFGVQRGDFEHWYRLFFVPFLHDGWAHVFSNVAGLLVLGGIVLILGPRTLAGVTFSAIVVGGMGLLFFGKPGVHAGASGVVYGYFGFLVARGFYARDWRAILLAACVLFLFQGMLAGLLPGRDPAMSWEGHLFGALGGVAAASTLARREKRAKSRGTANR